MLESTSIFRLVQEIVLPTWKDGSQLEFDCRLLDCVKVAQSVLSCCDHGLRICHQRIDNEHNFQVVVQHGGEAVLIIPTGKFPLSAVYSRMVGWVDEVHKYQGLS